MRGRSAWQQNTLLLRCAVSALDTMHMHMGMCGGLPPDRRTHRKAFVHPRVRACAIQNGGVSQQRIGDGGGESATCWFFARCPTPRRADTT